MLEDDLSLYFRNVTMQKHTHFYALQAKKRKCGIKQTEKHSHSYHQTQQVHHNLKLKPQKTQHSTAAMITLKHTKQFT